MISSIQNFITWELSSKQDTWEVFAIDYDSDDYAPTHKRHPESTLAWCCSLPFIYHWPHLKLKRDIPSFTPTQGHQREGDGITVSCIWTSVLKPEYALKPSYNRFSRHVLRRYSLNSFRDNPLTEKVFRTQWVLEFILYIAPSVTSKNMGSSEYFSYLPKTITLLPFWRWFITLKALLMLSTCSVTELHSQHVSIIN